MKAPFSRSVRFVSLLAVVAVALLSPVSVIRGAEDDTLPRASPEEVGMSSERLQRVSALMQRHIDQNLLAGTVSLIARHGKIVHLEAQGFSHKEAGVPMATDNIFTIMSMTKPIVTVALMTLFEEGHFLLNDPIAKWLPEYADKTVQVAGGARTLSEPAARPITVRHVLSHTSGLSIRPTTPQRGGQARTRPATLAEAVDRAADVPLAFHPGSEWQYGASTDYVAILVEKISDMSLDDFLRERIFEPLGMENTYYNIPESKVDQVAAVYRPSGPGNTIELSRAPSYREPTRYFGGQAGLSSTAADYFRFHQMMLQGGELDGVRLLSPRTVRLMTANHIGDLGVWLKGPGSGFGLGYSVITDVGLSAMPASLGTYGWGGAYCTVFWVDPQEEVLGILMTQVRPYTHLNIRADLQSLAYQAIVD